MITFDSAKAALTALGFGLTMSAANAGVINHYDFNGANAPLGSTFTSNGNVAGGPAVTVQGYLSTGGVWGAVQPLTRINGGIGLGATGSNGNTQVGPLLEGLLFDLGATFYASFSIAFSSFGGTDNADIWASTTNIITNNFAGAIQVGNNSTSNPFASQTMSLRYIFVANTDVPGGTNCAVSGSNCFRVDDLRVVPEPGSLLLVGAALGGLAFTRRRRAVS